MTALAYDGVIAHTFTVQRGEQRVTVPAYTIERIGDADINDVMLKAREHPGQFYPVPTFQPKSKRPGR